ncbi:MAG: hypothetical protein AVDCRST_MAG26-328 [uncultured Chloroflexia bacterium]|uniref:Uncharacterized protein n=1 Tax=uncultured Chloroflexia bacterium TaxID=1672391 RepID=A0A6J4HB04_9CHLR|nr:MAG: hypothetical protein AVDCRST_MAG26-328 [uncultured Chloroflexia bacterium]
MADNAELRRWLREFERFRHGADRPEDSSPLSRSIKPTINVVQQCDPMQQLPPTTLLFPGRRCQDPTTEQNCVLPAAQRHAPILITASLKVLARSVQYSRDRHLTTESDRRKSTMAGIQRTATGEWHGDLKSGNGHN